LTHTVHTLFHYSEWTYIWTQMQEFPDNKNKPTTPLWAEFCLTQRDPFGMLWLMIVVHILYFRSNHWMNKWKNIKRTS